MYGHQDLPCMKGNHTFHHGLYSPQRHGPESTWTEWNSAHACKNKSNYRASVRTSSCTQTPTHAPCPWSIFPCMAKHCESHESQKRPVQLHIFTSYCIPVFLFAWLKSVLHACICSCSACYQSSVHACFEVLDLVRCEALIRSESDCSQQRDRSHNSGFLSPGKTWRVLIFIILQAYACHACM